MKTAGVYAITKVISDNLHSGIFLIYSFNLVHIIAMTSEPLTTERKFFET